MLLAQKKLNGEVVNIRSLGMGINGCMQVRLFIAIKLVLDEEIINVISVYAPQVCLEGKVKKQFWEEIDELMRSILEGESIIVGGDLNRHVEKNSI